MKVKLHPESAMMSHGYKPELSEGAIKPPIFLTSTFAFKTAEEGKAFFELAYGIRTKDDTEELGLIYSRINNPNLEILEERLCLWDEAEESAVFESGMSAISTVLLEFLQPGEVLLYSSPTYGGTDHFINHFLKKIGIESIGFYANQSMEEIKELVKEKGFENRIGLVYIETPANPTNSLIDISECKDLAKYYSTEESIVPLAVDNTYMGPIWSHPLELGADLVIYSATKYIGGHSDLIAGAVLGRSSNIKRLKNLRTFLGNMANPHTCWLLLRSLETVKLRMEKQTINAQIIADKLKDHPKIEELNFLGHLEENNPEYKIYKKQYSAPGAMISIKVHGGEKEAFKLLNNLNLIKLAVSLGSTESLAQHPDTMTHAAVCPDLKKKLGITSNLVRLSVGVENSEDLINDLEQALNMI